MSKTREDIIPEILSSKIRQAKQKFFSGGGGIKTAALKVHA